MIQTDERHGISPVQKSTFDISLLKDKRKIMVPIDGSTSAVSAYDWAIQHIVTPQDVLLLVTVVEASVVYDLFYEDNLKGSSKLHDHLKHLATDILDKYSKRLCEKAPLLKDVPLIVEVKVGEPKDQLLIVIDEHKVAATVVGSRGLGAIKRLVLGSVSNYLLHNSPSSVVVVK